jgi:hypothetical protein
MNQDAINYINYMLSKKEKDSESIRIGRECAAFYKNKINQMLLDDKINTNILNELRDRVQMDFEDIINDSKHRLRSQTTFDNIKMMKLILDFILSI